MVSLPKLKRVYKAEVFKYPFSRKIMSPKNLTYDIQATLALDL